MSKRKRKTGNSCTHKVPEQVVDCAADDEPGRLGDELSHNEGEPVVHLGLLLASLEKHTLVEEAGLHLVQKTWGDKHALKDGEEPVLERSDRVVELKESE
jgi:hypothetical protein